MNLRANLTSQGLFVVFVLLAFELGLLLWLGLLLKQAAAQIDYERQVLETITHLERLSVLREKATSGLLQQQLFLRDDPHSARYKETLGQYLEQVPIEMKKVKELVKDSPEASANAAVLQSVLLRGTQAMQTERDLYVSGQNDALHVIRLYHIANSASQQTQLILDHYRHLEQEAIVREQVSRERLQTGLFVIVGLNVLVAIGLGKLFITGITKRLKVVTENSQKLASGKTLSPVMEGSDEIATLDHVFHEMANTLAKAAQKERAIIENAVDVICSIGADMRFMAVNPASKTVLGYDPEELIGTNFVDLIVPDQREQTTAAFVTFIRASAVGQMETMVLTRSGKKIDVVVSSHWSPKDEALFCVVHDISQSKEIERLKQEFTSMISHDLRTPLSAIYGTLELLQADVFDSKDDVGKRKLQLAIDNANRLLNLINDLLEIEKLEAGKMTMNLQIANIAALTQKSIDSVSAFAEKHKVQLLQNVPEIYIMADEDRLIQVLINLLSNAVKFSPEESIVTIEATESSDTSDTTASANRYCQVRIVDCGRGIPADQMNLLFERFRQTEDRDGKRGVGTGLGLSICKAIVEGHDGTIGAHSEVGKGTTFWFCVPLLDVGSEMVEA